MKSFSSDRLKFVALIVVPVVVLDQLTKLIAILFLKGESPQSFLANFLRIEYAENPGAFLSLGATFSDLTRVLVFNVAVGFFLLYVVYLLLFKENPFWQKLAFSLLLSGGIGNLIDRVFRGAVVDFLNLGVGGLRTGIFNVADMVIMAGLIIMLLPDSWLPKRS